MINPREVLSMDLKGPFEIPSIGGARFWLLIVDRNARYLNIYFLRKKSEVIDYMKLLLIDVKKEGNKIRVVRTDGGGEFLNKAML